MQRSCYSHTGVRLLFGEIAGKTKIRYPHMTVFIQEDVCGLKDKEVQESPGDHDLHFSGKEL